MRAVDVEGDEQEGEEPDRCRWIVVIVFVSLLVLGLGIFFFFSGQDDLFDRDLAEEPPRTSKDAVFDLDMDLSGAWFIKLGPFEGTQYIWQECMEVTITSDSGEGPLHHHIADGEYITYDDTETTSTDVDKYFQYKAIIARPTKKEAEYGATATLVFFIEAGMPNITQPDGTVEVFDFSWEVAVRFIDSDGNLRFQQNVSGGAPFITFTKEGDLPCNYPWTSPTSEFCGAKNYTDRWNSFTPACCGRGYGGSTENYFNKQPGGANRKW